MKLCVWRSHLHSTLVGIPSSCARCKLVLMTMGCDVTWHALLLYMLLDVDVYISVYMIVHLNMNVTSCANVVCMLIQILACVTDESGYSVCYPHSFNVALSLSLNVCSL